MRLSTFQPSLPVTTFAMERSILNEGAKPYLKYKTYYHQSRERVYRVKIRKLQINVNMLIVNTAVIVLVLILALNNCTRTEENKRGGSEI